MQNTKHNINTISSNIDHNNRVRRYTTHFSNNKERNIKKKNVNIIEDNNKFKKIHVERFYNVIMKIVCIFITVVLCAKRFLIGMKNYLIRIIMNCKIYSFIFPEESKTEKIYESKYKVKDFDFNLSIINEPMDIHKNKDDIVIDIQQKKEDRIKKIEKLKQYIDNNREKQIFIRKTDKINEKVLLEQSLEMQRIENNDKQIKNQEEILTYDVINEERKDLQVIYNNETKIKELNTNCEINIEKTKPSVKQTEVHSENIKKGQNKNIVNQNKIKNQEAKIQNNNLREQRYWHNKKKFKRNNKAATYTDFKYNTANKVVTESDNKNKINVFKNKDKIKTVQQKSKNSTRDIENYKHQEEIDCNLNMNFNIIDHENENKISNVRENKTDVHKSMNNKRFKSEYQHPNKFSSFYDEKKFLQEKIDELDRRKINLNSMSIEELVKQKEFSFPNTETEENDKNIAEKSPDESMIFNYRQYLRNLVLARKLSTGKQKFIIITKGLEYDALIDAIINSKNEMLIEEIIQLENRWFMINMDLENAKANQEQIEQALIINVSKLRSDIANKYNIKVIFKNAYLNESEKIYRYFEISGQNEMSETNINRYGYYNTYDYHISSNNNNDQDIENIRNDNYTFIEEQKYIVGANNKHRASTNQNLFMKDYTRNIQARSTYYPDTHENPILFFDKYFTSSINRNSYEDNTKILQNDTESINYLDQFMKEGKSVNIHYIRNITQESNVSPNKTDQELNTLQNNSDNKSLKNISSVDSTGCKIINVVYKQKTTKRYIDKKFLTINKELILMNMDKRKTCMIKNIPNSFSDKRLMKMLDKYLEGKYSFFDLRKDSVTRSNLGYAFITMISTDAVIMLYEMFHGARWKYTKSPKVIEITYARIQPSNS